MQSAKQALKSIVTAIFAIAILISATLAGAHGTDPLALDNSAPGEVCNGSTAEEYECVRVRNIVIRDELDKTYRALQAKLAQEVKSSDKHTRLTAIEIEKRLERSQRAWALFRDSDCQLESSEMIGSNREELSLFSCQLERTQDRIRVLKDLAI